MNQNNFIINGRSYSNEFDTEAFVSCFATDSKTISYSPIVQKNIGIENMSGVDIYGRFSTTYDSDKEHSNDGMCYIMVRRNNSGNARVRCGFGVAFKPSCRDESAVGYSVRSVQALSGGYYNIEAPNLPNINGNTLYLSNNGIMSPFTYETIQNDNIMKAYIPSGDITDSSVIYIASPNVYIIDGTSSSDDTYFSEIIKGVANVQCLSSGVFNISPNVEYFFRLTISDNNAAEFFLGESLNLMESVISSPAFTPLCEMTDPSLFTSFGISVDQTSGKIWSFDNIAISRVSGKYAASFMVFSVSSLTDRIQVHAKCSGSGSSGNGVEIYVLNKSSEWDLVGQHNSSEISEIRSLTFTKSEYATDGSVTVMLVASSKASVSEHSSLYLDYVAIESVDPYGTHVGGCVDVYIDDPDIYIETLSNDLNITRSIEINVATIASFRDITNSGGSLVDGVDYSLSSGALDSLNSSLNNYFLTIAPWVQSPVLVSYYRSDILPHMQSYVSSDEGKYIGRDVIVKHKKVYSLSIDSPYSEEISAFIKSLAEDSYLITYDSIIAHVMSLGYSSPIATVDYVVYDGTSFTRGVLSSSGDQLVIGKDETVRVSV